MSFRIRALKKSSFLALAVIILNTFSGLGQTVSQAEQIAVSYNLDKLIEIQSRFQKENRTTEKKLVTILQSKGIQRKTIEKDGTVVDVQGIGIDGTLLYYQTMVSPTGKVTRADALYDNGILDLGISGKNMKVGVWDAGKALETHQEFENRVQNTDLDAEIDSHSTMVAGVIASTGVEKEAKGVAYSSNVISNDWRFDRNEVIDAAMNGLLVSNHSYGIKTSSVPDWYFGSYIQVSKNWDEIMYNAPYYLMVSAAGNARNSGDNEAPNFGTTTDGFDLMLGFNTSKNGLVVSGANTNIDQAGKLENVSLTSYSSFGPIDDGRIKPDLAGDGTSIYSTGASHDKSYGSSMGTSMAAPGISASLILLQEYHDELYEGFMKAATLKGLALHTADDVFEPGPDYKLGWGVMNTKAAAELLQKRDFSSMLYEERLEEFTTYSIEVEASGHEALMVSLSWTDPEGEYTNQGNLNDMTPALMNDLDIRIIKDGETYYPWRLNPAQSNATATRGDNKVDPYERIEVANASGKYTIAISHKGNLKFNQQDFSLIISGVKIGSCELTAPDGLSMVSSNETSSRLLWNKNDDTLYEFQYKKGGEELWNTYALWDNTFEVNNLELGERYQVRVRGVCTANLTSDFSEELSFVFNGQNTEMDASSLDSNLEEELLVLYPNPTVDEVKVADDFSKNAQYYVTDMTGFIVKQGKLQTAINVSDLPTGMYVVNVFDLEGSTSGKFIKR